MHPWQSWMDQTTTSLLAIPLDETLDEGAKRFFQGFYRLNMPGLFRTPDWPALQWSFDDIKNKVGDVQVEAQVDRNNDPDYELNANTLKAYLPFNVFIDRVMKGDGNNVYLTAQNYNNSWVGLKALYDDVRPLPDILGPNSDAGFFWIGRETVTPLHHDLTNNLLCQIIGSKLVRLVSPDQFEKIQHRVHVHSKIGWLSPEIARAHKIHFTDFVINPGQMLFIPIGWWHCVKAFGPSVSISFTNFIWPNSYYSNFGFMP